MRDRQVDAFIVMSFQLESKIQGRS